ncbi:MAG: NAD(P)-dependent alcohol dehydrogenase [bacterium]
MKAVCIDGGFGLDNLTLTDRPEPEPGPGQVRLKMKAASLNYRDLLTVQGLYNPRQPLPLVPCSDGVGEVLELGEGVTRVKVGDRVCPIFSQRWLSGEPAHDKVRSTLGGPLDGTLAEQMVVDAESVVHVPHHLTDFEAAALPCAAVTAWTALVTEGLTKAGDTVLVQGTGGVALFALQIARLHGARVIITSSSDDKLARAAELGAAHGVNYVKTPAWGKAVRELTNGRGVDHVVELGGAGTLEQSLKAVRIGGRISIIGVLSGVQTSLVLTSVLMACVRLQGIMVGHRESFEALVRALTTAGPDLRPVIDQTFPLADVRHGFEHMAAGKHFGKIAVQIAE